MVWWLTLHPLQKPGVQLLKPLMHTSNYGKVWLLFNYQAKGSMLRNPETGKRGVAAFPTMEADVGGFFEDHPLEMALPRKNNKHDIPNSNSRSEAPQFC